MEGRREEGGVPVTQSPLTPPGRLLSEAPWAVTPQTADTAILASPGFMTRTCLSSFSLRIPSGQHLLDPSSLHLVSPLSLPWPLLAFFSHIADALQAPISCTEAAETPPPTKKKKKMRAKAPSSFLEDPEVWTPSFLLPLDQCQVERMSRVFGHPHP